MWLCLYTVMEIRVASRATSVLRVKQAGEVFYISKMSRQTDGQTEEKKNIRPKDLDYIRSPGANRETPL